jgi:nucleotide sugar dehydrogenase
MPETVGVIGVGKLGLCFALAAADAGFRVVATDKDLPYLRSVEDGSFRSKEPGVNELMAKTLDLSVVKTIPEVVEACPISFVFVPTPSLPNGSYDHTAVDDVLARLPVADEEKDLVICCTTMPGYILSASMLAKSKRFRLSYNPEFIAQGEILKGLTRPDLVLVGEDDDKAGEAITEVYRRIVKNDAFIFHMGITAAEVTKIALNCFLTMKISFANAIGDLLHRLACGGDVDNALSCIGHDSRVGNRYMRYGDGYGGPCLPRDNRALGLAAAAVGLDIRLSAASDAQNQLHLEEQLARVLLDPSKFFRIVGVTYKEGTDMIEMSQRLALAVLAREAGKKVFIADREDVIKQVRLIHGDRFCYEVLP